MNTARLHLEKLGIGDLLAASVWDFRLKKSCATVTSFSTAHSEECCQPSSQSNATNPRVDECCNSKNASLPEKPHLVIIGGGSAAFSATIKAAELGAKITMINDGLPTGGTCVNVGCIPSKFLIRAAETNYHAAHPRYAGLQSGASVKSFSDLIAQKSALVEELRQGKYLNVVADMPDFKLVDGHARLLDKRTVEVNGEHLSADRILIATGAAPSVPPVPGLSESGYLTNETAFELEELPESMIVLGGRYIALETAQMFSRLGTKVTILQRSPRILPQLTSDITDSLTEYLREEGVNIVTGVTLRSVQSDDSSVTVEANVEDNPRTFSAAHVLVATGRRSKTADMGLGSVGVELSKDGTLLVGDNLQTSVPGIYGAGDVIGNPMFVYTAAYEGAMAAENALLGKMKNRDYTVLPWVIFTDPQVAGVGLDEQQAAEQGYEPDTATLPLDHIPRSSVGRNTRGFIKLVRDAKSDLLLGARILAPEGSELVMEVALAIGNKMTSAELAGMFHPYLTLSEGIKLAAITFNKDVGKLSCCAS